MPGHAHGARKETAVEQMQDRMLDSADILIDGQPAIDLRTIRGGSLDPRIREAREIPRRVDERIHRVGLTPRRAIALWTAHILPCGMPLKRIAGAVEVHILRQFDGQVCVRDANDAAFLAVNDRNGATPVALARYAPVAQPKIDLAFRYRTLATEPGLEQKRDFFLRLLHAHAVKETGIDHAPVAVIGLSRDEEALGVLIRRANHRRIAEV